jgi:hypothetical protein
MTSKIEPYGRGIVCPFQRDNKGDFANDAGLPLVRSNVGEAIGVIGPMGGEPGELPWRGEFGSRLHALRHRGLHSDLIRATAEEMTAGPIRNYVKDVLVTGVQVTTSDPGKLGVRLTFRMTNASPDGEAQVDRIIEE